MRFPLELHWSAIVAGFLVALLFVLASYAWDFIKRSTEIIHVNLDAERQQAWSKYFSGEADSPATEVTEQ